MNLKPKSDYTTDSVHGQRTLHDLLLRTTILKIISECFVIARSNYVNLNAGPRSCKWNFKFFEWFIDTANQSYCEAVSPKNICSAINLLSVNFLVVIRSSEL